MMTASATRNATRPFRFGVVSAHDFDGRRWAEAARRWNLTAFTLVVADHYANAMACGPLLTAVAAATTTLRVDGSSWAHRASNRRDESG